MEEKLEETLMDNIEEALDVNPKEDKKSKKEKKDKYKEEIKKLNGKIKDIEAKVLSEKAELINYRKRKDEETSYMLKYANEDMVKEILPIVDNFERAIKLDDENLEDELSKFLSGFKMIYCHLVKVLENYGVKVIDGNNKPFDPNFHSAVLTEARENVEPGMVLEVMQKGYLLKDKVIRPAMVKVSE
jgi:Molecular chaperone GrpE (heat shock protein)